MHLHGRLKGLAGGLGERVCMTLMPRLFPWAAVHRGSSSEQRHACRPGWTHDVRGAELYPAPECGQLRRSHRPNHQRTQPESARRVTPECKWPKGATAAYPTSSPITELSATASPQQSRCCDSERRHLPCGIKTGKPMLVTKQQGSVVASDCFVASVSTRASACVSKLTWNLQRTAASLPKGWRANAVRQSARLASAHVC